MSEALELGLVRRANEAMNDTTRSNILYYIFVDNRFTFLFFFL